MVLRAPSAARFLPEEAWEIRLNVPNLELEDVTLRMFTRWVGEGGKQLPRELVVDVRGQASSLDEAVTKFSAIAHSLVTLVAFVTNVLVGPLEVHLAYESTPSSGEREFLEVFLPDQSGAIGDGRIIRRHLLDAVGTAWITHTTDSGRVGRALRHYELALRQWHIGGEWLAMEHLWMAAENLTTATMTKILEERGITKEELAYEYHVVTDDPEKPRWKNELLVRLRLAVIFAADAETHKTAKSASEGLEHGFAELDVVARQALRAADKTFNYIRQGIVNLLRAPGEVSSELMEIKPKDVQSSRKIARGILMGEVADPARENELYPLLEWSSHVDSVVREGATFQLTPKDQIKLRAHPDVSFKLNRVEIYGRLENGQAPLTSDGAHGLVVEHTPAAPSQGLLEAVMPLIDAATATGANVRQSAGSFFAFNMFGQAVALVQSVQALVAAALPVEALAPLRGLILIAGRFEQMADPNGAGLGIGARAVLESISSSRADSESIARQLGKTTATVEAEGLSVPAHLEDVNNTTIVRSLEAEMLFAADVVSGAYGSTVLHLFRIDEEHVGFQTKLQPGALTDMVVSAAAIAMLDTLSHAAELLEWTVDVKTLQAIASRAREVNNAVDQQQLVPPAPKRS